MKSKIAILSASLMMAASSFGAVYNLTTGTAATSHGITETGLLNAPLAPPLPGGSLSTFQSPGNPGVVGFGIFTGLTDAQISVTQSPASLISAFVQFGQLGAFNSAGPTGQKGLFTRNTADIVSGTAFANKNMYLFVGNGTTYANSTEFLVLKSDALFTAAQDDIPTAQTVTLTPTSATLLIGRQILDVRTTSGDTSVTAGWGTAKLIPEPSTALLGLIGALGLLRRRR
jgi:hypothetical protein